MFTCIPTLSVCWRHLVLTCFAWLVLLTATISHARPTPLRPTVNNLAPVAVAAAISPSGNAPLSVTAVDPTKCYRLVARANGKVLSLLGGNDGAQLATYAEGAQTGQRWQFIPDGAYYNLQSQTTQKGVQVVNASTAENALLENWTYWGGGHQQWTLLRNTEGFFTLINRNSGKAMTVLTAISGAEARVGQQIPGTAQQQQWSIEEYACSGAGTPNRPPVVVANSTSLTGASPLSATFTGSSSSDPDGDLITYLWDFGDGTSSTQPNPATVFSQRPGAQGVGLILNYTVRLTVTDSKGLSSSQTLQVRLNNNAPTVKITSPLPTLTYALDKETNLRIVATLADELPDNLAREYKTTLRRDNRTIWSISSSDNTTVLPVGCNGENYYYLLTLKVTDKGGLSAIDSVKIYPKCDGPTRLAVSGLTATTVSNSSVRLNWTNPTAPYDDVLVVGKAGAYVEALPGSNTNVANPSFTGNGATLDGGKVLYQGTSASVVITNLPAGQNYFFRVFSRKGSIWGTGMPVTATPMSATTTNRPPVVVTTTTSLTGASPLSVTFTGSGSSDPDGDALTYDWQDATTFSTLSTQPNPVLTFLPVTVPGGTKTTFTVRLALRDSKGATSFGPTYTVSLTTTPPPTSVTAVEPAKCYRLVSRASGKVLTSLGPYEGAQLVTFINYDDGPGTGQRWQFNPDGAYYSIQPKLSPMSVQVFGASLRENEWLETKYYVSSSHQQWTLQRNAEGYYALINRNSGKAMTELPPNGSDEARVGQQTLGTAQQQQWSIEEYNCIGPGIPNRPPVVVTTTTSLTGASPLSVTFTGSGSSDPDGDALTYDWQDATTFSTLSTQPNPVLTFSLVTVPGGTKTTFGVRLVLRDSQGAQAISPTFTVSLTTTPPIATTTIDPAKCYRIQSRSSGLALTVPAGAGTDGTSLQQRTNAEQPWQKWRFTPDGSYYRIAAVHSQKAIQVANSSTADNALLEQWTYWGGGHQQWTATRNAEGFFTLSNRNAGKAMTVQGASTADGASITQQTLGTGTNQQWTLAETTCPTGARLAAAEPGLSTSFLLYPNPATDHVLIDLSRAQGQPVHLKVHNLLGISLQQTYLEAAPAVPYRFRTDQLPDGLYLMQVTPTGQAPTTLRLLIQH